jgi:ABC-type amino acid transport substrate-binding protein
MKKWLVLLVILVPFYSFGEVLKIGTENNNPPFSSKIDNQNHFYGFDMEIMSTICRQMHVVCHFESMVYDSLLKALNQGEIDLAIASIIITPAREQEYAFSKPYMESRLQFLTLPNHSIQTPNNLINKRIGILQGTPFKNLLLSMFNNQITIREYLYDPELLDALDQKEVDAVLLDKATAQYWHANTDNKYQQLSPPIAFGKGYGIVTKRGRTALIARINDALKIMGTDGSYTSIKALYFRDE